MPFPFRRSLLPLLALHSAPMVLGCGSGAADSVHAVAPNVASVVHDPAQAAPVAAQPLDSSVPQPSMTLAGQEATDEPLVERMEAWLQPVPPPEKYGDHVAWWVESQKTCVDCFVRFEHAARAKDGSFWIAGGASKKPTVQGVLLQPAASPTALEPLLLHVSAAGKVLQTRRFPATGPGGSFDQIHVQADGSLRVLGSFYDSVTLGSTKLTRDPGERNFMRADGESAELDAAFVAAFDPSGRPRWGVALAETKAAHVALLWDDTRGNACIVGRRVAMQPSVEPPALSRNESHLGTAPPGTPDPLARNTVAQCFDRAGHLAREADLGAFVTLVASPTGDGAVALVIKRRVPGSLGIQYDHLRLDAQLRVGRTIPLLTEAPSWESVADSSSGVAVEKKRYLSPGHVEVGGRIRWGAGRQLDRYLSSTPQDSYVVLTRAQRYSAARTDVLHVDERTGAVANVQPLYHDRSPRTPGVSTGVSSLHRDGDGAPVVQMTMQLVDRPISRTLFGWRKLGDHSAVDFIADRSLGTWFPIPGSSLRLGAYGKLSMLRPDASPVLSNLR